MHRKSHQVKQQKLDMLCESCQKPVPGQRQATKELRQLTKKMHASRALFGDKEEPGVRTKVATVIFLLSTLDDNRNVIRNCEGATRILVCLIEEAKQILMVKDVASALYTLSIEYEKGKDEFSELDPMQIGFLHVECNPMQKVE
ncbi:hypothetical protein VNO77_03913 [Canavalia gladiata]|uniref:Uncharacterized protein n=1 Tax=Canavalia gladiata TaxID=3824 RepID=A0AAN9N0Q2_CANGL